MSDSNTNRLASAVSWRVMLMTFGLSVLAAPVWAQVRVTDGNILFLYESRADVRAPDHELAAIISKDYKDAADEFTRHDLLQKIKPVIERRLSEAEQTERVHLVIGSRLGNYDFERSAFPSDMSDNTYIAFDRSYRVQFDNADRFAFIPVPQEEARSLAGALRISRAVTFRVEGTISRVAEDWDSAGSNQKVVYMQVDRVVLSMKNNRQIASLEVQ